MDGKDHLVHYGDPNMEMQRDNPDRREAFLQRHSCDTKKDPLAPGFWACLDWQRTSEKSAGDIDDLDTMTDTTKAGRRNNRSDRQRLNSIRTAATDIVAAVNEMEPAEEENTMPDETKTEKAMSLDEQVEKVRHAVYRLAYGDDGMAMMMKPVETECEAVYADHVIIERDDTYYRATYTIADNKVEIQPMDQWQKVEEAWLPAKSTKATSDSQPLSNHRAIKALGRNRVGGYMMLWGNEKAKDLDGEYFTPDTEEMTSIFKSMGKLPYLYHHAMDDTLKTAVIGTIDVMEPDDVGLWYEAQLNTASEYRKYVDAMRQMISRKMLGTSSGTLGGAARVDKKTGRILRWPIVEGSATPTPADPRQVLERPIAEIKSAFKAVGLDTERLEQLTSDTAKADTHTDSEPEPKAVEPKTGAQPVVQAAADGEHERNEQAAKRLSLELDLLLLEE